MSDVENVLVVVLERLLLAQSSFRDGVGLVGEA